MLRETRVDVDDDDGLAAARDTRLDGLLAVVILVFAATAAAAGGFIGSVFAAIDLLSLSSSSSDDELPSFKLALLLSSFSELDDLAL